MFRLSRIPLRAGGALAALVTAVLMMASQSAAAVGWIMENRTSLQVIAEEKATETLPVNGFVGLMVLYAALVETPRDDTGVTLTVDAAPKAASDKKKTDAGEKKVIEAARRFITTPDGNTLKALVAATGLPEKEFIEHMNAAASSLGMHQTSYKTPYNDELAKEKDYENRTTLADQLILLKALLKKRPDLITFANAPKAPFNPNLAMPYRFGDATVFGMGPGTIDVALVEASEKELSETASMLYNLGAYETETVALYKKGQVIATPPVYLGRVSEVPAVVDEDVSVTLPKKRFIEAGSEPLKVVLRRTSPLLAPLGKNAKIGELVISYDDKELKRIPVRTASDVDKGGQWRQFVDTLKLTLNLDR